VVVGECFKLYRRRIVRRGGRNEYSSLLNGLSVLAAFFIAGCSLAPFIASNSIDYNTTVESVTNSVLVTNILRARDGAPLYFSDLSQIRGSLQLNVQPVQATLPFGKIHNSVAPGAAQAGPLSVNTQPGFDFAPLNTKNFAKGMLNGIDANMFAYFFQRTPPNILLNLVVSQVERYRRIGSNKDDEKYILDSTCNPDCVPQLLASWTANKHPLAMGQVSDKTSIGPPIPESLFVRQDNALRSLIQADGADLDFSVYKEKDKGKTKDTDKDKDKDTDKDKKRYQLSKSSTSYVLCLPAPNGAYEAVGIASPSATKDPTDPPLPTNNGSCKGLSPIKSSDTPYYRYVIYLRSVEAIFYYLGGILEHPERPSPIHFYIYDHPEGVVRFNTNYRGQTYYVREYSKGDDYTITILSILADLLNLNRDANEIPSTKTVAAGP
jgi:hypothetical protein